MKRLTCIFLFLLLLISFGCDDTQKPMTDVLLDQITTTTEPETETVEVIETITFDNVLALETGKQYKVTPVAIDFSMASEQGNDQLANSFYFGSMGLMEGSGLLPGLPEDTPVVFSHFDLNPAPYAYSVDNEPVFGIEDWEVAEFGKADEILIEIKRVIERGERTSPGGRGRDPVTYFFANYSAVAVENLTNPDRKFEYE